MTPTTRVFNALVAIVARVYDLDLERITTEERMPAARVREARQVICYVASKTVGLTTRQIGILMQRDAKAAWHAIKRCTRAMLTNLVLARVVSEVARLTAKAISRLDVLAPEAAQ